MVNLVVCMNGMIPCATSHLIVRKSIRIFKITMDIENKIVETHLYLKLRGGASLFELRAYVGDIFPLVYKAMVERKMVSYSHQTNIVHAI